MAAPLPKTRFVLAPPLYTYFTFSIDVTATLKLYCGGGDEAMLQKLDGMQDHKYAGYCLDIDYPEEEEAEYTVITVTPIQQGLTKPHPRKPQYARPTMCIPVLPTTAHPRSRKPLEISKGPLPWKNCYHPTCYDVFMRVPAELQDSFNLPSVTGILSLEMSEVYKEDKLHRELLSRPGLDDDRIQRILDGQEEVPERDILEDVSQISTDSPARQIFLAKVPGSDKLEDDWIFTPVMRINLVLSDAPEIRDPSELSGDLDLFQDIVKEYQLAHYGSTVFLQPQPEMEIAPFSDEYSSEFGSDSRTSFSDNSFTEYDSECRTSGCSTEDTNAESADSHVLDLSLADESGVSSDSPAPVLARKGKWKLKLLFRRTFINIVQIIREHKFSAKL